METEEEKVTNMVTWDNLITLYFTGCLENICKNKDALKIMSLYLYRTVKYIHIYVIHVYSVYVCYIYMYISVYT